MLQGEEQEPDWTSSLGTVTPLTLPEGQQMLPR